MSSRPFRSDVNFVVRIGGEAGDGVISCGELFAQAAARTEYHVFTYITYPSEIRGGFSMVQIRIRDWTIYSMGSRVDYLVVFNQESYDKTISGLREGGMVIYDPDTVTPEPSETTRFFAVPLTKLARESGISGPGKNVIALGALGHLFDIDPVVLKKLIRDRFRHKGDAVVERNIKAVETGYEAGKACGWGQRFRLKADPDAKASYMMLSGNEAVALGAIAAGCRFVAGYPITPATPIFETLCRLMPKVGGKAVQMEDEIASISAIVGAAFAGEKVLTPTSGPGLQLMGEQINLASMLELPVVIVNVQRGGPSTGLPTKTEQSDLKFAIYGTAGESPRVVLAPSTVEDCFYQTIRAFNIAEIFQVPVVVLTDQSIGYRKATVRIPDFERFHFMPFHDLIEDNPVIPNPAHIDVVSRLEPTSEELADYKRFRITDSGISPISRPGTPGGQYLATGLEHTEKGHPDYTPENHQAMTSKRFRKIEVLSNLLEKNPREYYGSPEARIGIIGWGSTEGAIREARYLAEQEGVLVRHLHPKIVLPMADRRIRYFLAELKHVIVVEENYTGQFAHFIRARFGIRPIEVHKCQGLPITPREILAAILNVARISDEQSITRL
ncbi:MAG: 2-oxoacid:acceptor oxidoreductase subunit alpha [Acidobacteriota bacterium]|nr:2-oxoacid:acceptor oxidoreductase subunit alpha [Acidobacteriota bacterium]